VRPAAPLHETGLGNDLTCQIFALLPFEALLKCISTCRRWHRYLSDTVAADPWRSAFVRSFPAAAGFNVPCGSSFRDLAYHLAKRSRHHELCDLQFAVTLTRHGTVLSTAYPCGPRLIPLPPEIVYSQTHDYATSRPTSESEAEAAEGASGFEWDISLPLPAAIPTECAPDGRGVVILSEEALVATMWLEASKRYEADGCGPCARSRYLELEVVAFRKGDGKVLHLTAPAPLGLLMQHRLERLPYALEDRLMWRDHCACSSYYLAASLRPKHPPLGTPVPKAARLAWTLSLELCRAAVVPSAAVAYVQGVRHPLEDVRAERLWRDGVLGPGERLLSRSFFARSMMIGPDALVGDGDGGDEESHGSVSRHTWLARAWE